MNAPTFGTATRTTAAIDPAMLNGWSVRPGDWQIGASVQQQLLPRVSVEVGYFQRWLKNFTATDNLLGEAGRLHAVQRSRRRRIRGCQTAAATRSAALQTSRGRFGRHQQQRHLRRQLRRQTQVYNGVLLNVSARGRERLTFRAASTAARR